MFWHASVKKAYAHAVLIAQDVGRCLLQILNLVSVQLALRRTPAQKHVPHVCSGLGLTERQTKIMVYDPGEKSQATLDRVKKLPMPAGRGCATG